MPGIPLSRKAIRMTEHAIQRMMDNNLTEHDVEKAVMEGERLTEGKTKTRYRLKTKKGLVIVVAVEDPTRVTVITVTKRNP